MRIFRHRRKQKIGPVFSPSLAIEELAKHFKMHDGVPLRVDPERLLLEWEFAKTVVFDVRLQPTIANTEGHFPRSR